MENFLPIVCFPYSGKGRGYDVNATESHFLVLPFLERESFGLGFTGGFVYPAVQAVDIVQQQVA